jgi:crotonobetainyl-CoA:carnitine CoA-transferase CaiB-like acyl-CoA transferase
MFAARTLAEWTATFATLDCPWAPVQNTLEVANDPQARANGYLATVRRDDGSTYELVASPVRFDRGSEELRPAPAFAADTDAILAELGYDEDAMIELKIAGAVT